jgi:hypothetical protein
MVEHRRTCNYSIEGIAQSIVKDSPVGKRYCPEDKRRLYAERLRLLESCPGLKDLLSLEHIRSYATTISKRVARIGILPPELVVVDSRIQDMCSLPFWTYYGSGEGSFSRCAGVGAFSCCPPFTPTAEAVQGLMDQADFFVALQTSPTARMGSGDPGAQFRMLNQLADDITAQLGSAAVVQKFGGGPCFACYPETCLGEGKCRAPRLKIPSLESMGVCVDQLCKDLALLSGDKQWQITWIRGFGAAGQMPKRWKGTFGLAIAAGQDLPDDVA